MTHYQNNRGERWLLVPVKGDADDITLEISKDDDFYQLEATSMIDDEDSGFYGEWETICTDLPPANYTLICTSDEITEEQARGIIDSMIAFIAICYRDYETENSYKAPFTAKQSFQSLLHSLNLSRVVVLKIEE